MDEAQLTQRLKRLESFIGLCVLFGGMILLFKFVDYIIPVSEDNDND